MIDLERFDRDIMTHATYYEVINYVADYVQRFLDNIFEGGEIKVPVPIENILEKLEIEVVTNYYFWESKHIQGGIYIDFEEKKKYLELFWESSGNNHYMSQWIQIKSIARYIVEYHEKWCRGERIMLHEIEYIQRVPRENEQLINMVAWQLMLPWRQGMQFLVDTKFFDNIKNGNELILAEERKLANAIDLEYASVQKINAYYHLINTIEAKRKLGEGKETFDLNSEFFNCMFDCMGGVLQPKKEDSKKPVKKQDKEVDTFDYEAFSRMTFEEQCHIISCMHDPFDPND